MASTRNISGYLPNLLGPVKIRGQGTETTARPAINFTGAGVTVTDDPTNDATVVTIPGGGGGGSTPTGTGFRRVVGGVENAAASLVDAEDATHLVAGAANTVLTSTGASGRWQSIVNANVSGAAAIAGTKIAPDFGAQNVVTTGYVQPASLQFSSSNIATAGLIRLPSTAQYVLTVRDVANTGNLTGIYVDGANGLNFGSDTTWGAAQAFTTVRFGATTAFQLVLNGATFFYVTSSGPAAYQNVNFGLYGGGASFPATGGGVGVFAIGNAGTVPTTTPTGGGVLYATGGALHWLGSGGTDTPIANAEPHCPRCGTDVGVSGAKNDLFGEELVHCHACELRTGNGVVVHVADFFERRKAA